MGMFVAGKVIKLLIRKGHKIEGARALILGITFKENCPDIRNSRVIDIYRELVEFGLNVEVYDPYASATEVQAEYGITLQTQPAGQYDAIILAVAHQAFSTLDYASLKCGEKAVIYDTKAFLDRGLVDARL
jgi:UDP-N-acetyl-D-galactosamine dehydrogenase